ncbi:MAG: DNA polymerase III subunit delta' [Hyphomicrobiaceae bacterium]|nr:DNA polymerase III subunit delta' [Hyphomicrobiaceae bacterium]
MTLNAHDRLEGWPLPQEAQAVAGHDDVLSEFTSARRSGRLHHAWLFTGERGIGKATVAFTLARDLLMPEEGGERAALRQRTGRLVEQLAHPDLFYLSRRFDADKNRLKQVISVEDTRAAMARLGTTAADGGHRVVIVDAVDDLNANSANALLKVLEEPPGRTVFFLIAHRAGAVLPTLRSRCRQVAFRALDEKTIAFLLSERTGVDKDRAELAAALSGGSLRRAIELAEPEVLALCQELLTLLAHLPNTDPRALHGFAERIAATGEEAKALMVELIGDWLHRRVRGLAEPLGAGVPAAHPPLARWSEVWDKLARLSTETDVFNLDRKSFVFLAFEELASAIR